MKSAQRFVVYVVKTALNVALYKPDYACKVTGNLPQGSMTAPVGPKPVLPGQASPKGIH